MTHKHTPQRWRWWKTGMERAANGVWVNINDPLVAAAPELLEALERGVAALELFYDSSETEDATMSGVGDTLERMRAAIAKARGES